MITQTQFLIDFHFLVYINLQSTNKDLIAIFLCGQCDLVLCDECDLIVWQYVLQYNQPGIARLVVLQDSMVCYCARGTKFDPDAGQNMHLLLYQIGKHCRAQCFTIA